MLTVTGQIVNIEGTPIYATLFVRGESAPQVIGDMVIVSNSRGSEQAIPIAPTTNNSSFSMSLLAGVYKVRIKPIGGIESCITLNIPLGATGTKDIWEVTTDPVPQSSADSFILSELQALDSSKMDADNSDLDYRSRDGQLQIWDPVQFALDPTTPFRTLVPNGGIGLWSAPIAQGAPADTSGILQDDDTVSERIVKINTAKLDCWNPNASYRELGGRLVFWDPTADPTTPWRVLDPNGVGGMWGPLLPVGPAFDPTTLVQDTDDEQVAVDKLTALKMDMVNPDWSFRVSNGQLQIWDDVLAVTQPNKAWRALSPAGGLGFWSAPIDD